MHRIGKNSWLVDSDERVAKLEAQNKEIFENFKRYDEIVSQTKIIEEGNRKKDEEIKKLQQILEK